MGGSLCQRHLQAVVVGFVYVRKEIDVTQIREAWIAADTKSNPVGCRAGLSVRFVQPLTGSCKSGADRWLIKISQAQQLRAVISDVCNLHRHVIRDSPLDAERPGADIGRTYIAVDAQDVTGR